MPRFDGKVALITGGGSGIGAATARLVAREGGAVAVMGRTARTVEATAEAVRAESGRALAIAGDISWWRMRPCSCIVGIARFTSRIWPTGTRRSR
jgi:NAD(P)-dependent dehydrogenase (short-subunit alcohol dehydrogenase family)